MKTSKFTISLLIGIALLIAQFGSVSAAPALEDDVINGTVTGLECMTEDGSTILVTFEDEDGMSQEIEIDLEKAMNLGLVTIVDGQPDCSEQAFQGILDALSKDESQHPVGAALSLFFGEIADYDVIMAVHDNGTGFGVIAQALWLTSQLDGDADFFMEIVQAKHTGDFSSFELEDGSAVQNWGQLKKAILTKDGKNNLGTVMSNKDNEDKTKNGQNKDKGNNGKGQDKDKDKNK